MVPVLKTPSSSSYDESSDKPIGLYPTHCRLVPEMYFVSYYYYTSRVDSSSASGTYPLAIPVAGNMFCAEPLLDLID